MTGFHEQWKEQIREARGERLRINRKEICRLCKEVSGREGHHTGKVKYVVKKI